MSSLEKLDISGPHADEFRTEIGALINGELPDSWEWVNSSKKTLVAKRERPTLVYYKEFLSRSHLEGIKGLFKGNRGDRARKQGEILQRHGFHSPMPLCWGRINDRNFLLLEGVDSDPVGFYIYAHWGESLSHTQLKMKHEIIRSLAMEVGRLHMAGIIHGDLRLNNILMSLSGYVPVFHFIDNERNECYKKIPEKLIIKNLLQLNLISPKFVSFKDRLRFFHVYNMVYGRFDISEQKKMVDTIWELTLKRFQRPSLSDCHHDLQEIYQAK